MGINQNPEHIRISQNREQMLHGMYGIRNNVDWWCLRTKQS